MNTLIESFEIDDGSLYSLTPQQIFAMGVEWEMFRQMLKVGNNFSIICMTENVSRLVRLVEKYNRFVEDRPTLYPQWREIWVGDTIKK